MGFVDMSADDVGVIALGELLGWFAAQTVQVLWRHFTEAKGLPQMVDNHITLAVHPRGPQKQDGVALKTDALLKASR